MATQPGLLIPVELSATTAWTRLLGVSDNDIATALTTGSDGAIYASVNTISASDPISALINGSVVSAFITKYNADGTQVWTKQLGTTDNKVATSLSTGSDGSIYISGSTIDILGLLTNSSVINAFVTKYNADGTEIWTKQLETTDNKIATALSTGSDGSIYISGNIASGSAIDILSGLINSSSSNTTIITDVFVTKYNADGSQVWTKLLETSDNDVARSITTGSDGAIYVSGNTRGNLDGQTNNGGDDAFITKYNADGTKVWTKLLGTGVDDVARSLTIGSDGAIYVSGNTRGNLDGQTNNGGDDAFITKYNADGTKVWTKLLGTGGDDVARSLTIGSDGAIYVSGNTRGNLDGQTNNGGDDAFITKYNADGTKVWTKLLGTGVDDVARSLTIGSDGAIYVSGNTEGDLDGQTNNGGDDAFITKLFTTLNNPPTDLSLDTTTIDEGQTTVGNLTTTDPDTGNTFTYSLVTGDGATDNSLFTITNNQLKTNSVFDFETKNSYSVRLRTTDQDGLSFEKQLTIGVSNVNETPTDLTLSNSTVTENQVIGTVVGNLSSTDPDTGNTFTYSLVTGDGATDNS
ncbi:hypothetical protein H6G25_01120, partial [Dolichospermum sp. FACHB-1091]|uniref:hypothetical protein n=1 Tax=Dolichospermum sp. FACHB-1091 TaxID=2692798 RepID=UPI0018EFA7A8